MNKELILTMIGSAHDALLNTFNAVPDDKLTWKPLDNGRTALDAFGDAAQRVHLVAQLVQKRGDMQPLPEYFAELSQLRASWDKTKALEEMEKSYAEIKAAIEPLSEEDLAQVYAMPLRARSEMPLGAGAMLAYRMLMSRFAQINYIQTLYGDFEPH